WELFEKSYNADLANNLGNLVNRVTSMAHRYRGGVLNGRGVAPDLARFEEARRTYWSGLERLDLAGGTAAAAALARWPGDRGEGVRAAAVPLAPSTPGSSRELLRRLGVAPDTTALRFETD